MTPEILLVSNNTQDIQFWSQVASRAGLPLTQATDAKSISGILDRNDRALIFWDAQCPKLRELVSLIQERGTPHNVFAITDEKVSHIPELFLPPVFAHHLYRRYVSPADFLCAKLIERAISKSPFSLEDFLKGPMTFSFRSSLSHSLEKYDRVEQVQQLLIENGVIPKLAGLGADATDELLMNAIFDAPWEEGKGHYRRSLNRADGFELSPKEKVEIEVGITPELVGIRICDQFGSLRPDKIIGKLGANFSSSDYIAPINDPGAGLGIYKIVQSALTLIFVVHPGARTEAIVLFSNKKSYRDVRMGFCFFSLISC